MEVEDPTSDVAGSDLNPLAVGVGIQPVKIAHETGNAMSQSPRGRGRYSTAIAQLLALLGLSQSPRGRGRYSTTIKATGDIAACLNPLAVGVGIQPK